MARSEPMMLDGVGFWFNEDAPSAYPRPQALVGAWDPIDRARVLAHLGAGLVFETYFGWSECRICEARVGCSDLTDGRFVWPEGLAHYVELHSVQLPEWFVAHAGTQPVLVTARIDDARWLDWGRARGAAVELAGWSRPSIADQERLAARLEELVDDAHVLASRGAVEIVLASDREVALRLDGGELAVVTLATGATELIPGWDAWNARRAT